MIRSENPEEKRINTPFSVLISVYYKENPSYFSKALESVVEKQTLRPSEVVLVKDGPLTPELEKVIDHFKPKHQTLFKIIGLNKNMGLGLALREGLINCTYSIVARMDSDDISLPERFEKQMKVMTGKNVDVVGCNTLYYETNTKRFIGIKKNPETMNEILQYAKRRSPLSHVTVMFRKDSVLSAGSYCNQPYFEDYWLWIRMLTKGMQFYSIQEPLVVVRYNNDMVTRRGGRKYLLQELEFLKRANKIGFLSHREKLISMLIRTPVRLLPCLLRKWIYSSKLRMAIKQDDFDEYHINIGE
ncbi:MAG TPA: glycosyltransferase [Salinivirgaceae bacterium]|nr:glycosyltransferase [Salinivirgaceae bacterium]